MLLLSTRELWLSGQRTWLYLECHRALRDGNRKTLQILSMPLAQLSNNLTDGEGWADGRWKHSSVHFLVQTEPNFPAFGIPVGATPKVRGGWRDTPTPPGNPTWREDLSAGCLGSSTAYESNPERKERHPKTSQLEREREDAECEKFPLAGNRRITWVSFLTWLHPAPKAAPSLWLTALEVALVWNRCHDCFIVVPNCPNCQPSFIWFRHESLWPSFPCLFFFLPPSPIWRAQDLQRAGSDSAGQPSPSREPEHGQPC